MRLSPSKFGEQRRAILDLSAREEVDNPADQRAAFPDPHAVSLKDCGNLGGGHAGSGLLQVPESSNTSLSLWPAGHPTEPPLVPLWNGMVNQPHGGRKANKRSKISFKGRRKHERSWLRAWHTVGLQQRSFEQRGGSLQAWWLTETGPLGNGEAERWEESDRCQLAWEPSVCLLAESYLWRQASKESPLQ